MKFLREIFREIRRIEKDRVHGAVELGLRATALVRRLTEEGGFPSALDLDTDLMITTRELIEAQPAMATMVNLEIDTTLAAWKASGLSRKRRAVISACRKFEQKLRRNSQLASRRAAGLIGTGCTVLTHSFSNTVLDALLLARRRRKRFRVICTESRPKREGRKLACALEAAGIPARVIGDAAAVRSLPEADLVLVGADAVSVDGLVNKFGTASLVVCARHLGKAAYAVCGTEKFVPDWRDMPPPPRDFDRTPLNLFTAIITEVGLLDLDAVSRCLRGGREQSGPREDSP